MNSVVQSSSSVYSTYIATVDHLPCDIVRSLWLVQSCNLRAAKEKEKLDELLLQQPRKDLARAPDEVAAAVAQHYYVLQQNIRRWNDEALAEMDSLCSQLESHEASLQNELLQLQNAANTPVARDEASMDRLREQLNEHYRKNPLQSQVEALQERVLKDLGKVVIKKVAGQSSGIKIILKLSGDKRKKRALRSDEIEAGKKLAKRVKPHIGLARVRLAPGKVALKQAQLKRELVPEVEPEQPKQVPRVEEPEQYCFCKQASFGDMIACDNARCPNGEWFHYKCVGLLNRAEVGKFNAQKWYCSDACRLAAETRQVKKKKKRSGW